MPAGGPLLVALVTISFLAVAPGEVGDTIHEGGGGSHVAAGHAELWGYKDGCSPQRSEARLTPAVTSKARSRAPNPRPGCK